MPEAAKHVAPKKPFGGIISNYDAANAIRAARLNALDLFETAQLLFSEKKFAHSLAISVLAIEEASKPPLLLALFLNKEASEVGKLWKRYRSHQAKTAQFDVAMESRVRATFPDISPEDAKEIGALGPTPKELDDLKQLALYSDCLDVDGRFAAHLPNLVDWQWPAWERLCEAQALSFSLRDYTPGELAIWLKHADRAKAEGRPMDAAFLSDLHEELKAGGHVKEGWWDTLLKDAKAREEKA